MLLNVIGEGGAAVVYRAACADPGAPQTHVALKLLNRHAVGSEAVRQSIVNEARLGACLRHPNIAQIHEFDRISDTWYVAMELVPGYTVSQLLYRAGPAGQGLPHAIVAAIGVQICAGLDHAHSATDAHGRLLKVVHRDLKPSNVMVTLRGTVKIMDFGTARATSNLSGSFVGQTKGTPSYMSPEQVQGQALDGRSDLFSLASLLAQVLTGERVFEGEDHRATMHAVLDGDVAGTLDTVQQRAPAFVPILQRAWQTHPDQRYASAARMGSDLQAILDDLPGTLDLGAWMQELHLEITADHDGAWEDDTSALDTLPEMAFEWLSEHSGEVER